MTAAEKQTADNSLALHVYPALKNHEQDSHEQQETFVLLHGWGCDHNTWEPLIPYLQKMGKVIAVDLPGFGASQAVADFSVDALVALLEQHLPDQITLIGWSLGGMLAVALAARAPSKIARVITLAANAKFVASADYVGAMPPATNHQFNNSFVADPEATLKLFNGLLAQGDANERGLLKSLRAQSRSLSITHNWQQALMLLAELDNRSAFASLTSPGLHIFAQNDVLVPVTAVQAMTQLNPRQEFVVLPDVAHAIQWSQPQQLAQLIENFLASAGATGVSDDRLDKRKVAYSFSRAACSYDSVASLQREVGTELLRLLPESFTPQKALDLGCGTGFFSQKLYDCLPQSEIFALDIAEGMVKFARVERDQNIIWVCGDAENLPLQNASVDLIFTSLAIQWCNDLPQLFGELQRILKPGGRLLFSTLGPTTLHQLRSAWQSVDGYVHVNRFQSESAVKSALSDAGFIIDHWQVEARELHYEKLVDLTRELKALGAHNINRGQSSGLTGRQKAAALKQAYEQFRCEGLLPASYEVYYGAGRVKSLK